VQEDIEHQLKQYQGTAITVTVGDGGAGVTAGTVVQVVNGSNSSISGSWINNYYICWWWFWWELQCKCWCIWWFRWWWCWYT
jgi:hypothetical protein